jgi:hypothetical protein
MVPAMGSGGSRIRPRGAVLALVACCAAVAAPACGRDVNLGALADQPDNLLWTATFERGDLLEWSGDGQGGADLANIGVAPSVTTEVAHTGRYAGKATVIPASGTESVNYFVRQEPSPARAYYGAWFFIAPIFSVKSWLSIIHFRGSHTGDGQDAYPIWDINLYPRTDGTLVAHLYSFASNTNVEESTPVRVPIGQWVHFEVFFDKASDPTGSIVVWQDGAPIIEANGIATVETAWLEWGVGGSSNSIAPAPGVLYVDDATISVSRMGGGG